MIAALCQWFDRSQRDLPWRKRRNGYTALVAESMLQQTQVSRVINRYREFLRAFPTVEQLASASEQQVLMHWDGLGYYRRALNLHAAAKLIVREFAGRVPRSAASLQRLPGVGRYTAGAIASMVYGLSEPAVDGNVYRVLSRLFAHRGSTARRDESRWAWAKAEALLACADRPGRFNEAMMELGATVCTPRGPQCGACPLAQFCKARSMGAELRIPPARGRTVPRVVHHHAVLVQQGTGGRVLLEKRPKGMWSGMWQTPTVESREALDDSQVRRALSVRVRRLQRIGRFQHVTTHRLITFHVFTAHGGRGKGTWRSRKDAAEFPMSSAMRRILREFGDTHTAP